MNKRRLRKPIAAAGPVMAVTVLAVLLTHSPGVRAQGGENDDESKIQHGLAIAPVPLNLTGKNRALVGIGSYIVNAVANCNGCHSAGPSTEFTSNGSPYLLPPIYSGKTQVRPETYLGGGDNFGQF